MQKSEIDLTEALGFACRLADAGGRLIREMFRQPHEMEIKGNLSPVTAADKAVETCVRQMIASAYPEHGIMGEEHGNVALDREYVWVIDPIDGTKQFAAGLQTFGMLIALARNGSPVLGLIDQPVTGDRWTGVEGMPSCYNGHPIRTRPCLWLADAVMSTTGPDYFRGKATPVFEDLNRQTRWTVYGGGCHGYGVLAGGTIDLLIEARNDPFDYCAHVPIVQGAGGVISDWNGDPLTIHSGDRVLATGDPQLYRQALARIQDRI
jgi:histidinol phosphatase-like enzyme (inositol monophosphatase family)